MATEFAGDTVLGNLTTQNIKSTLLYVTLSPVPADRRLQKTSQEKAKESKKAKKSKP